MTRDIAAHVRLLEHGLPDQPERAHAYVDMLGHNVYPVRLEPGTGIVWRDLHGLGVTTDGVLVALVGSRWERVGLGDETKYRCPRCERDGLWTDGTVAALGDARDEYWCQTCGAESPLEDCQVVQ